MEEEKAIETYWHSENIKILFDAWANYLGLKPKDLMLPLRIMLTGKQKGPSIFEIIEVLGPVETKNRITKAIQLIEGKQ